MKKLCKNCDREFESKRGRKFCDDCMKLVEIKCSGCSNFIEVPKYKYENNSKIYCSRDCQRKNIKRKTGPGICTNCGKYVNKRSVSGYGVECGCAKSHMLTNKKRNNKEGLCCKCGIFNNKRIDGYGVECGCHSKRMSDISGNNRGPGKCIRCQKYNKNRSVAGLGVECGCAKENAINLANDRIKNNLCVICNKNKEVDAWGYCKECRSNNAKSANKKSSSSGLCVNCRKFNNKRDICGLGIDCGCTNIKHEVQAEYWKIFKDNDTNNKLYNKAKDFCENSMIFQKLFINKDWLSLSIEDKISEEEKWISENSDSKLLCYHKRNLELLKLKQSGEYWQVFKNIEEEIKDYKFGEDGYIYGHIDIRNNELYYIGQTIQTPIERYAEHLQIRKKGLSGNDKRFNSAEEYISKTGINQERIDNTKVVILHHIKRSNYKSDNEFKEILNELEQNSIKCFTPKLNFYMVD